MAVIAVAGKGGVGKSTISALLAMGISERDSPLLAVDADPNHNLGDKLGLSPERTVADVKDELRDASLGIDKCRSMEYAIATIIEEGDDIDLITMGRPDGKGCYCFVNDLLGRIMAATVSRYEHTVVDNEAGMEHVSRGILPSIDSLVLVSDPTVAGLNAARRVREMTGRLAAVGDVVLVVNMVEPGDEDWVRDATGDFDDVVTIPREAEVRRRMMRDEPLTGLEGPVRDVVSALAARLIGP